MTKHIASCSFGKDSIATVLLALEHGDPLDEIVYCEVMFDDYTSAEIPEHKDFIYNTALPYFRKAGLTVTVLRPEKTFNDFFYRVRGKKSKYCGKMEGFPMIGKCVVNSGAKVKAIKSYLRNQPPNLIQYIGIALDEPIRLAKLQFGCISLLAKYGFTESMAVDLCRSAGLLSPIYDFTTRNGCFFCPNSRLSGLRHLRQHHPDLWQKLLDMGDTKNLIRNSFNISKSLEEIEEHFFMEDAQLSFDDILCNFM